MLVTLSMNNGVVQCLSELTSSTPKQSSPAPPPKFSRAPLRVPIIKGRIPYSMPSDSKLSTTPVTAMPSTLSSNYPSITTPPTLMYSSLSSLTNTSQFHRAAVLDSPSPIPSASNDNVKASIESNFISNNVETGQKLSSSSNQQSIKLPSPVSETKKNLKMVSYGLIYYSIYI